MTLALKLFRREPAITWFDWPFTPIHSSSKHFSNELVRTSTLCYQSFILAMDRSPGFGSNPHNLSRYSHSLSLRLHQWLNLAVQINSQAHYAKGMRSQFPAPTLCRHMISDSISLPSRGSFHLSLAVLVHYRSPSSI